MPSSATSRDRTSVTPLPPATHLRMCKGWPDPQLLRGDSVTVRRSDSTGTDSNGIGPCHDVTALKPQSVRDGGTDSPEGALGDSDRECPEVTEESPGIPPGRLRPVSSPWLVCINLSSCSLPKGIPVVA